MNDRFSADDLPRRGGSPSPWPIDLAHVRPFRIGGVEVRPASREVVGGDRREVLEPLVMQVLVALARARGEIMSRDDLIDACWGGRAVTDDAINRVMTHLRALARSFGTFQVETVTKVGYRLVAPEQGAPLPARIVPEGNSTAAVLTRRRLVIGAFSAAAVAAGGVLAWRNWPAPETPRQAELLIQRAMTIMQDGRPEEQAQALAYLEEATRVAPRYAQAWGILAMHYALRMYQVPPNARPGEEIRCRSAARTALGLDPNQPFASCALALLVPPYRNWRKVEGLGETLTRRFSSLPVANHILSDLLADVGRWREAVVEQARIDRSSWLIPLSEQSIILALWAAGDIQRAETLLDAAVKRWPQHQAIWNLRINFLMFSGRAAEAVRLLEDQAGQPPGYVPEMRDSALSTALALADRSSRAAAIQSNLNLLDGKPRDVVVYLNRKISSAQMVVQRCAALGDNDNAFAILDGYYFGTGRWAALRPAAGDADRNTVSLFEPAMSGMWRDSRFDHLLERIGLNGYWQQTGTQPDYRRGSA